MEEQILAIWMLMDNQTNEFYKMVHKIWFFFVIWHLIADI